ncbi:alpha/beta hydrolase [Roseofilum sp. BLCC_M91]|uniref:Alpha/beta hydrolase n=1 Tax=Roseofilum halophilum BLCC-M91 TaxID=3022259 RepID=A0ABT7BFI7_9CYAN|nr:alpha/beta hydrolase [Roseofilum halophilum]MDJ1177939.1 alpha/beta hydrolase [Roseofilum halophilum BLCC-M91]
MSLDYLQFVSSSQPPQGLVIFLHGWGANAPDLYPLAEALNLPDYQFIFPNAPFPHPQVPGGLMWYDLNFPNPQQLQASYQQLKECLEGLSKETGVPLKRMVLAGFSQGGGMTLNVGFSLPLAGLICMSGYLHAEVEFAYQPRVFIFHGRFDPVVPLEKGKNACEELQNRGIAVTYEEFDMAHQIIPEELERVRQVLVDLLA